MRKPVLICERCGRPYRGHCDCGRRDRARIAQGIITGVSVAALLVAFAAALSISAMDGFIFAIWAALLGLVAAFWIALR